MGTVRNQAECRELILSRLRERDRQSAQFERIIRSYQQLAAKQLMAESRAATGVSRRRSKTGGAGESALDADEELEKLRTELASLYKLKANNDQQLIDAKNRLDQLERELRTTQMERDTALHKVDVLKQELAKTAAEMRQLRENNQCLLDEHIAMQAAYNSIKQKYEQVDQERAELINRLKEFKEREITLVNEMNEREQQLQWQKLQCELAEAAKPNPVVDARAFEVVGLDEAIELGPSSSGAAGGRERLHSFGDVIPDRCRIKFECNDLGEVNDVRFHPNGRFFFTAGIDKKIKMWEWGTDSCVKRAEFTGANQGITRIDIHPESGYILGSSNDYAVRVWSLEDQRQRFAFTGHSDKVTSAKFMQAGQRVASGSNDRTIKIWDTISNRCQKTFFPGSTVCDLATNDRYGAPLISAHFDKSVRFWDTRSGDSPTNQAKFGAKVTSLYITADAMYLLCSARDDSLTLLDLRNNDQMHVYSAEQYRSSSDYSRAVISPGDSFVAAGSADGHIFVWNLHSTRLEKVFFRGGHENAAVLSLAWHPSGHMLLSGDKRKTACLWR